MNVVEGKKLARSHTAEADVVVVGTGPAGAAAGLEAARAGARVIFLEEGPYLRPSQYPEDGFSAMALMYRGLGATISHGSPMMPLVQGRVVGGTSVVNGAISWRLPRDVHEEWLAADPGLGDALSWKSVSERLDEVESELNIHPTEPEISGANNLLLAKGADALGIENRPISRNVRGCKGLGRCLQGCPQGNKLSMDLAYLPEACERDARVYAEVRVDRVAVKRGRATGVRGVAAGGGAVDVRARHAVVLAASAVQTPVLLLRSGIKHGPVGENFQAHPGASVTGRFPEEVRLWAGATQGHEVIGLRREGIKLEALGYDMALVATRLKGVGHDLARDIADMSHQAHWGAAIRAASRGRVRALGRHARVAYSLGDDDMRKVRRGVRVLGEVMLAAGADFVEPGVFGWQRRVQDRKLMASFETEGPLSPKSYTMAVTHMFGTCRMGTNPERSVVRPDFRHHRVESLYIADSSVFPTNLGVNPQTTIIALAKLCGQRVADAVT